MANDGNNRWIVLLNISPKGPLTEEEIRTLLEQGVLRRNDLAYLLAADAGTKTPTEWKLLWQFPEFDRRREEPVSPLSVPLADRRTKEPDAHLEPFSELPLDLQSIAAEDLLPKSSAIGEEVRATEDAREVVINEERPEFDAGANSRSTWIFGTFALTFTSLLGLMVYSSFFQNARGPAPNAPAAEARRSPTAAASPAVRTTVRTPGSSMVRPPRPSQRSPYEEPPPPIREEPERIEADHGDIPEEEAQVTDTDADEDVMAAARNLPPRKQRSMTTMDPAGAGGRRMGDPPPPPPADPESGEENYDVFESEPLDAVD